MEHLVRSPGKAATCFSNRAGHVISCFFTRTFLLLLSKTFQRLQVVQKGVWFNCRASVEKAEQFGLPAREVAEVESVFAAMQSLGSY